MSCVTECGITVGSRTWSLADLTPSLAVDRLRRAWDLDFGGTVLRRLSLSATLFTGLILRTALSPPKISKILPFFSQPISQKWQGEGKSVCAHDAGLWADFAGPPATLYA